MVRVAPASPLCPATVKIGSPMGITYISGIVTGPKGQRTLDFLVDSGATYTLLPVDVWQAIGLLPKRTATFSLSPTAARWNGRFRNAISPWMSARAIAP